MKRLAIALLAVAFLFGMAFTAAIAAEKAENKGVEKEDLPKYVGPKKRIAVMDMAYESSYSGEYGEFMKWLKETTRTYEKNDLGDRLTEMLTTALMDTGRFIVLERKAINDIRDEIRIGEELGNEKTAVKRGNVLGAQLLVRAAVTEFTNKSSGSSTGISLSRIGLGGKKSKASVTVDVRVYDANTSQIIASEKATGDSESKGGSIFVRLGSVDIGHKEEKNDPIQHAVRIAIEKAVQFIVKKADDLPWEGWVAEAEGMSDEEFYINRGSDDGLKEGDVLIVAHPGKNVVDSQTGEVLQRKKDVVVGECKVLEVNKRSSVARLISGSGVKPGDVVKLK